MLLFCDGTLAIDRAIVLKYFAAAGGGLFWLLEALVLIETSVAAIQQMRCENGDFVPSPATEREIAVLANQFHSAFGLALPEAYQRVLRVANGVLFDGLTIWPTQPYWLFRESLVDANSDLREMVEESLIYLGKRDDSVFVLDPARQVYAALEISSLAEWETFPDADVMMASILERVLDE